MKQALLTQAKHFGDKDIKALINTRMLLQNFGVSLIVNIMNGFRQRILFVIIL
jgi:hypothetical protein